MSTPTPETTPKVIKICPGCAMNHVAQCQKGTDCTEDQSTHPPHSRLQHGLTLCRQVCGVSGDVTVYALWSMMLELLVTCASALRHLASALLPTLRYCVLLLLYAVDGTLWALEEKRLWMKGLKGAAVAAMVLALSYFAYTLLTTFVIPTLYLFIAICSRTRSLL